MRNRRFLPFLLTLGLIASLGAALVAVAVGQSGDNNSANSQYCPPSSPGAGEPKDPGPGGNQCGTPGTPGNPNSPGQGKKTRHKVSGVPRKFCASKPFRARVQVLDAPANGRSRAYVDGKKVKTTGKDEFAVRVNPRRMSPGKHRLVIKTRDANGKMVKKVVTFLVCPR